MAESAEGSPFPFSRIGLIGILGPVVFTATWIFSTFLQDSYSTMHEDISGLAADTADNAWVMMIGFLILGVCIAVFGYGFRRFLGGKKRQQIGPVLVVIAGLGIFSAGIFRNDCSTGVPACEALYDAGEVSWHHHAHDLSAIPAFVGLVFAPIFSGFRFRKLPEWRNLAWPSIVLTPVLIALILGGSGEWRGLFQRLIVSAAFIWLILVALRLRSLVTEE